MNWWALNIAYPALVLQQMPHLQYDWMLWFPAAAMWCVFFGAMGFFRVAGRIELEAAARPGPG